MERFKKRRRSSGPSWMRRSSPGEKNTLLMLPKKSALLLTLTPLTRSSRLFSKMSAEGSAALPAADELAVVADAERRTRAQVKDRFGAVGLALRVAAREDVEPVRKGERLVFVVPEIVEGEFFYAHAGNFLLKNTFLSAEVVL